MNLKDKIRESNRIEGILRAPTTAELNEFKRFMALGRITVPDLSDFVSVYQPGAFLRSRPGLDVRVGNHYPPSGGTQVVQALLELVDLANEGLRNPTRAYWVHHAYETLHPFTDGNGRSGRMLWYWMMQNHWMADLGFLRAFYYQALQETRDSNSAV